MKPRPKLDPVTLRWLADRKANDARRYAPSDDERRLFAPDTVKLWALVAGMMRQEATTLRNLATRAERSPTRPRKK